MYYYICGIFSKYLFVVTPFPDNKDSSSSLGVGDLEITPVSAAIARHLGIDLSAEGKAAMRRRGVGIIVHGAPLSGKCDYVGRTSRFLC